jgi:hypothetical protein
LVCVEGELKGEVRRGSIKLAAQISSSCGQDTIVGVVVVSDFIFFFPTQFGDKVVKSWDDNAVHAEACVCGREDEEVIISFFTCWTLYSCGRGMVSTAGSGESFIMKTELLVW